MAFECEEIISVPHALMKSSARPGIMDAKYECVGPISFYGPSLPEFFCRCKLKVIVYDEEEVQRRAQENAQNNKEVSEARSQEALQEQSKNDGIGDQPSSPSWMQWALGTKPDSLNESANQDPSLKSNSKGGLNEFSAEPPVPDEKKEESQSRITGVTREPLRMVLASEDNAAKSRQEMESFNYPPQPTSRSE